MSKESDSVSPPAAAEKCSLVLVDVAGTTTPIDFVKETLFPFFLAEVHGYVSSQCDDDSIKDCLKHLDEGDVEASQALEVVKKLKHLQGQVYKQGYEKGQLKARVFDDVPEAFETWAKTRRVAIYSSGSVESQKLLFTHTTSGDISTHIEKYFDLSVGAKTEAESYKKIAQEVEVAVEEIVFITDDIKEATAAKSAGVNAVLVSREGNPPFGEAASKEFIVVSSFNDLVLDKASKRKRKSSSSEVSSSEAPPSKVPKSDEKEEGEAAPSQQKLETVEEESMEVDIPAEKPTEETKTATEKTEEKLVENAPEKTEPETSKAVDEVETKQSEDSEMKEVEEKKEEETVAEASPKEEQKTVEAKPEETQMDVEQKKEETKPEQKEETKPDEAEPKVEEPAKSEPEEAKAEEAETSEKKEAEEKSIENGEQKPEEAEAEAETSAPKVEEKENKSVLANGVENGSKDESEVDQTEEKESESAEVKDDLDKDDETEVKVKKLEESAESKTVSVEV